MIMNNKNSYIPFIIIGLFYFPILVSNQLYVDDIFRAQTGFDGWTAAGRPLSDILLHTIMMTNGLLIGFGQLGQLLSIIALAITSIYFSKVILGDDSKLSMLLSCGFAISPFYLENISYQYDSFPMTLALCLSMFATWGALKNNFLSLLLSSIAIALSLSLYQTAINSYMGFVSVVVIVRGLVHSDGFKQIGFIILRSIFSLFIGLIIYAFLIKVIFPMTGNRGQEFILDITLLDYFYKRIFLFYDIFISSVSWSYSLIALSIMVFSVLINLVRRNAKVINTIMILLCIVVILLCPIGMLFIFKESGIAARMMMGSASITCLLFSLTYALPVNKKTTFAIGTFLLIPLFVISYSYSYSIKEQRKYDNDNILISLSDIRSSESYNKDSSIVYAGRIPVAPLSKISSDSIPLVKLMIVPAYDWTASLAAQSIGIPNVLFNFARKEQKKIVSEVCLDNEQPLIETSAYSIYKSVSSNGFLVWLKGGKSTPC